MKLEIPLSEIHNLLKNNNENEVYLQQHKLNTIDIDIPLIEIKSLLKYNYAIEVKLQQNKLNTIEIDIPYLLLKLEIKEVKKHELTLRYGPNSFFSKIKFSLFKDKINDTLDKINNDMIKLDKINLEINIDLRKVEQLKTMLNLLYIYQLKFSNRSVIIKLKWL